LPSATDFFTIAKKVSKKRFWVGLSQWLNEGWQKTAMPVEKTSQAQRLKQFFARPPARGYNLFVFQSTPRSWCIILA